jgi:hypothetical protein
VTAILDGSAMSVRIVDSFSVIRTSRREIVGCALIGGLGILLLQALMLRPGVYYMKDAAVLYSVAQRSPMARVKVDTFFRPLEYLIVLAANNVYLPIWLGASLLCQVGATILSALACETLFQRQLPKTGWWILGVANPLLFYLVTTPGTVSQCLCNLFFAGALLAFICESNRLSDHPLSGWRADHVAVFLNLMAAVLFFTKETAVAAAVLLPAATALTRLKIQRFSCIFASSLLLPIGAAGIWILVRLQGSLPAYPYPDPGSRMGLKLNPFTWGENFIITLAFPVTPLPSSFIAFGLLRTMWIVVALGSVTLFIGLLLREAARQPKIVFTLLIVAASCAPMILIHASELYSSMIAAFAVSIMLLFGASKIRWPSVGYGLLLYAASLGNGIVYFLGADFSLLGLQHLPYGIYGEGYQKYPTPCPIQTTAHIAWDGTEITCVR